uniref:Ig-like domain-containing protein n=2 Tax=Xenopus tropicalis TaxID=8364 RepID=A0A803J5C4_XENTR
MSYHQPLELPVKMAIWEIKRGRKIFALAEYNGGQLEIHNEQFMDRLQASDSGASLRISSLRMEDTDVFKAEIILTNLQIQTVYFNLTVHEPVPAPTISAYTGRYSEGPCEFTLNCSVPTNTSLIWFSWMYREGDSGYRHHANGSSISITLQNLAETTEFLCLAQNPADIKNASFNSQQICQNLKSSANRTRWIKFSVLFLVVAVLCLVLLLFIKITKH